MDILPLHIEYLLSRHDCVIVPGLGAFIATETEAVIDLEAGIIRPRRREISFNSSVVTDDGLLAHSIARRERIPYEEARKMLLHLVDRMHDDLEGEGEVSLGMTGRLVKDEEGMVNFQPRRSAAFVDILPDIRLAARIAATPEKEEIQQTETPIENEEDADGMRTIRVRADHYVFTISKRAVHAAAMLVAVFTVALSLIIPINHDNEQKASVISLDEFFRRPVQSVVSKVSDSISVNTADNDSISSVTPLEEL